ncbi:MAG: chorismate mutase [Pseudomonas sp.]
MNRVVTCSSLEEVRTRIDRLDRQIVGLVAERGGYVRQAARFKRNADEVQAPQRVAQVLAKVEGLALEQGADPQVVEALYRAMIAAFIEAELAEQARLDY